MALNPCGSAFSSYVCAINIPTEQQFLSKWYAWTVGKVSRHYKRDKDRILDTVQNVRLRLLSKKFIWRWFFKHLTDEVVTQTQASKLLGGAPITYIGSISPVHGRRSSADSLWRVRDLLDFARFDYDRYFYSAQNHTIDSDKILRLLGYPPKSYGVLESMYRQGRLKPSELTEHLCIEQRENQSRGASCSVDDCNNKHYSRGYCSRHYHLAKTRKCEGCDHGRKLLALRGVSLASRWTDPAVADAVSKLRWNDSQLEPFLRAWRRDNIVSCPPDFIMRPSTEPGIDAGLLKYAQMVIDNEVVNDFKRISRSDDLPRFVLEDRLDPTISSSEIVGYESDENDVKQLVLRDINSKAAFRNFEGRFDIESLVNQSGLTDEEVLIIQKIDLEEIPVRQFSEESKTPIPKIHRLRTSAIMKMRSVVMEDVDDYLLGSSESILDDLALC